MNQVEIGKFIVKKRKEKNLTQESLAEKIGVSNKTISKWENGKCMPDYSVIQSLCKELNITISELMDAEEAEKNSIRGYDDTQVLDLIRRMQNLENQRISLYGIIIIVMGMALEILHYMVGGSAIKDFFSGLLLGMSIVEMLIGVYLVSKGLAKQK